MASGMNLEQAKIYAEKMSYSQAVYNALCGYGIPYKKATKIKLNELLDAAKNIDARHAHWIKGIFADIRCSNCDFSLCVHGSIITKLAYCPHCGAKMDEVKGYDSKRIDKRA